MRDSREFVPRGARPRTTAAVAVLLASCGTSQPTGPADPAADATSPTSADRHREAARALVDAPPRDWHAASAALLGCGPEASPALIAALRARGRGAAGAQPALAVLGALGGEAARDHLSDRLDGEDDRLAAEAALALGRLGDPAASDALRTLARDHARAPWPRAAALAALLDLHRAADVLPELRAMLLAGSPSGAELAAAHGLPDRARWALELEILYDAIRRRSGGRDFGLDPDLAWPDRAAATERALRWLEDQQR